MENYAFIDGNNIHLGIKELGWDLDYKRFRIYLNDKYYVTKAFYFIGFIEENRDLYKYLESCGYILIYKQAIKYGRGSFKGNCDAELVLHAMIEYQNYDQAVIVTSDGDFACLLSYLNKNKKLKTVLAPEKEKCSILIKKEVPNNIAFLEDLKRKIGRTK
jgi:uncharacterized LabA/DUF88 family protein